MDIGISQIISAIIGLLAGFTIGISINIKKSKTKTVQKNNIVDGDMAGRNINK